MQLSLNADQIWISTHPSDFRRSIDGLCAYIVEELQGHPQQGVYIFFNRNKNRVKILSWHKNGFVLVYKRLERGRFTTLESDSATVQLSMKQLNWLLAGLDWLSLSDWKELGFDAFS